MLRRSFGAGTLGGFWRHWNPIWSYGLGRFVQRPLRRVMPATAAMLLTFGVSGFIHDAVIMGLRGELTLLFTPWFLLIAGVVLASERLGRSFAGLRMEVRAGIHIVILGSTFAISASLMMMLGLY